MNITFKEKFGQLLSLYRRPVEFPILLRFSSKTFCEDSADDFRIIAGRFFGNALNIWSEPIKTKNEVEEVMCELSIRGSTRIYKNGSERVVSHFIYAFFSDWPTDCDNVKLIFDMIFIGNRDFCFSGNIGESVTLVRRVFENSPEYVDRINKLCVL